MSKESFYSDSTWGDLRHLESRHEKRGKINTFYKKPKSVYVEKDNQLPHPCEAPTHVEGCNGIGNTKDHFTPKSILRELRKKYPDQKFYTAIQRPSRVCHDEKDRTTPYRAWQVRMQLMGAQLDIGDHITEIPTLPHHKLTRLTAEYIQQNNLQGQAIHTSGYAKFKDWSYYTAEDKTVFVQYRYVLSDEEGKNSMPLFYQSPFIADRHKPKPQVGEIHFFGTNATVERVGDEYALFAHTISRKDDSDRRALFVHIGRPAQEQTIFMPRAA